MKVTDEMVDKAVDAYIDAGIPAAKWCAPSAMRAALEAVAPMLVPDEKYHELLMAVASKFPNESRHETALRYITERENRPSDGPCTAAPSPTNEGE